MRITGLDGKTYPSRLAPGDLEWLVGRTHFLSHDERLSVRQIVARLNTDHGIQRSVGTVHSWLRWSCDRCSGGAHVDT